MKKANKILWGSILVAVGVLFGLRAFDLLNFDIFFDGWWTLFIIIPCFTGLFTQREKTGNIIGLLLGLFLLLCCQGIMNFDTLRKLILPLIIVIIGIKMIFGGFFSKKSEQIIKEIQSDGRELKSGFAAFSGQNLNFGGEIFDGAELNAVFGGIKCDLNGAFIEKDCVIKASAIFGGITIYAPPGVNVKVTSNSIFGGISSKDHQNSKDNAVTLYVNGSCMFGGVEIK